MRIGRAGLSLLAVLATLTLASPAMAQDKMVTCKDGSSSKAGRGACSGHGGVADAAAPAKVDAKAAKADAKGAKADAKAAKADSKVDAKAAKADTKPAAAPGKVDAKAAKADAKATKADAKASTAEGKATAKCKDGSMSYAKNHTGACSGHGGVAEWLDGTAKKP